MFYSVDKSEDLSPGHRKKSQERELGYSGDFFAAEDQVVEHQKITIKENQKSQDKEFSTFLCVGRCKSLGQLKSLL